MSGECEKCGEHTMDCRCSTMRFCKRCENENVACVCMPTPRKPRKKMIDVLNEVTMDVKDAIDLIHWARRYCDGRSTPAPSSFNQILKRVRAENECVIMHDSFDQTLKDGGLHWPFAQDGMYDAQNRAYDATK